MTTNVTNVPDHMSHMNARNHKMYRAVCIQCAHFPCDDCENTCTLSHYHHKTGSMNHLPLFRVRSWNNGMHRMSFYVVMVIQNGRHFADDVFKCFFWNENVWISLMVSLKFVPNDPINNIPAWVQIMAWRRSGDKPLSEPMMVTLLTHICVTRPQWVNMNLFSYTPRNTRN